MTEAKSLTTPRNLSPFAGEFDQIFNRMMRGWPFNWADVAPSSEPRALRAFEHMPKVEVKENGKTYSVTVELPGLDEKDVKVEVEDDVLTISGEKKVERPTRRRTTRSAATAASRAPSRCRPTPIAMASRPSSPRAC